MGAGRSSSCGHIPFPSDRHFCSTPVFWLVFSPHLQTPRVPGGPGSSPHTWRARGRTQVKDPTCESGCGSFLNVPPAPPPRVGRNVPHVGGALSGTGWPASLPRVDPKLGFGLEAMSGPEGCWGWYPLLPGLGEPHHSSDAELPLCWATGSHTALWRTPPGGELIRANVY